MAGFESIVRPVVFPDIRPMPKQSVRPQEDSSDDPEKGMCVIRGTNGKIVQLPYSYNASSSSNDATEIKRQVDEVRVYQREGDGTVNRKNFVDIEVANKMWMKGSQHPARQAGDPIPTEETFLRPSEKKLNEKWIDYYKRVKESENVEIRKRDQMRKNQEVSD